MSQRLNRSPALTLIVFLLGLAMLSPRLDAMPCTCCGEDISPIKRIGAIWQGSQVRIHWNDPRTNNPYTVYRQTGPCSSGAPGTAIGAAPTGALQYLDAAATPGTAYSYRVSTSTGSCSAYSECVDATQPDACIGFSGLQTIAGDNTGCASQLAWIGATTTCGGTITYDLYRSLTAGFTPGPSTLIASNLTDTSYNDAGRWGMADYYYVVRARDNLGHQESNQSRGYARFNAPVFGGWNSVVADYPSCSTLLDWNPPASSCGPVSFRVYRSNSYEVYNNASFIAAVPPGTTYYADVMPSPGLGSGYIVKYVDAFGIEYHNNNSCLYGPCSYSRYGINPIMFTGVQTATTGAQSVCAATLTWPAAQYACGSRPYYNIYRSTDSSFTPGPAYLLTSGVAGTSYTDVDGLLSGLPYYYVIRAIDSRAVETTNVSKVNVTPASPASPVTVAETFEGSQSGGGFDQPGWNHFALQGNTDWQWSTAASQSPVHSWYSPSQGAISARALISPALPLNSGSTLSFWHTYEFDDPGNCFDGGTLEISTNDGASWSVVPDGAFTAGGFTGTVSGVYGNPLGGKRAWCSGTLGAMSQVTVNLAAWAGQTVRLRWRAGEDYINAKPGWYVDSVTVTQVGGAGACTTCSRPLAIASATAQKSGTDWRASWSGISGVSAYRIYKSTAPHPVSWGDAVGSLSSTTIQWFDSGALSAGGSAFYTVTAVNSCGAENAK